MKVNNITHSSNSKSIPHHGQWLTSEAVKEYQLRAAKPGNNIQDMGQRRLLRIELQEKYGLLEIEAINILNGRNVSQYLDKYNRMQNNIPLESVKNKVSKNTIREILSIYEEEIRNGNLVDEDLWDDI